MIAETRYVHAADERRVAYKMLGPANGYPIFLEHGTPGCKEGPIPRSLVLHGLGVLAIARDRPGYYESDRQPGRRIVDGAADIQMIADDLGLERFGVAGRSGGGPYALAAAAKMPHRVSSVLVMAGLAPRDLLNEWSEGMVDSNKRVYETDDTSTIADIRGRYERVKRDPSSLLDELGTNSDLRFSDRVVLATFPMRKIIEAAYEKALEPGPYGWIDDVLATKKPWGFDLSELREAGTPIRIWQGGEDGFSPPNNAQALAAAIGHDQVELTVEPYKSHFDAMVVAPQLLGSMVPQDYSYGS